MSKTIYLSLHNNFFDKFIIKKREEIYNIIIKKINFKKIKSILDVGATEESSYKSSNYLAKKFKFVKNIYGLSNQNINKSFYKKVIKKSIVNKLSKSEEKKYKTDLVISNAVLEHVGSNSNQKKMLENIIKLSKKYFVLQTPNRYHPIEFHTKLLFIHWLPKKIFRKILKFVGLVHFSKEKNLNLVSEADINRFLKQYRNKIKYNIYKIKFFGFTSNLVIIGYILKK